MQAVPLAFPPRKINKPGRQLLFKLGASILLEVGLVVAAAISPGRSYEDSPSIALAADLFLLS